MSNGFGRIYVPDSQDEKYQIRSLTASEEPWPDPTPSYAYWHGSMFLDQGSTPQCVEYSWHHYLQTGRIRPRSKYPYWVLGTPYMEMQRVDEFPGENYDGTSVRAGAKVMQAMGFIDSYLWAWDIQTTIDAVLRFGPVVVGTNWYEGMFYPEYNNNRVVKPTGRIAGGHAWLIEGANRKQGLFRAKNSWGRSWGRQGRFWISFEDMERLINEDGEVCLAVESQV
jgi:hypothetical protein